MLSTPTCPPPALRLQKPRRGLRLWPEQRTTQLTWDKVFIRALGACTCQTLRNTHSPPPPPALPLYPTALSLEFSRAAILSKPPAAHLSPGLAIISSSRRGLGLPPTSPADPSPEGPRLALGWPQRPGQIP